MIFVKAKLFWKKDSNIDRIQCMPYDDNIEYYTFLRKCRENGLRQVIVTSEIMTQLIRQACLDKGHIVYRIEFVEEDSDIQEEISDILKRLEKKPAYLGELLNRLRFLAENSSIDLKRIYIKGPYKNTHADNYFVQSNGIIGINKESYASLSVDISSLIERCLNG